MRYCIIINDKIKEEHPTLEEVTPRLKLKNSKLVIIPDIGIGLKIYSADNRFIGEIVDESDNLWFTRKTDDEVIPTPWMKENFEEKYIRGLFIVGDENED